MAAMDARAELTEHERARAAAVLEQVLTDVAAGDLTATARERAFIAGTVLGLRGGSSTRLTLMEPLV